MSGDFQPSAPAGTRLTPWFVGWITCGVGIWVNVGRGWGVEGGVGVAVKMGGGVLVGVAIGVWIGVVMGGGVNVDTGVTVGSVVNVGVLVGAGVGAALPTASAVVGGSEDVGVRVGVGVGTGTRVVASRGATEASGEFPGTGAVSSPSPSDQQAAATTDSNTTVPHERTCLPNRDNPTPDTLSAFRLNNRLGIVRICGLYYHKTSHTGRGYLSGRPHPTCQRKGVS